MARLKARQTIKNSAEEITKELSIIKNDNTLLVHDDGINMKLIINDNELCITRDSQDMNVVLCFSTEEKKTGSYKLKQTNTTIDLDIVTKKSKVLDYSIELVYELYASGEYVDKFSYKLDWSD